MTATPRIPLQPEWDLIQRKVGAANALQDRWEYWCYEPWPDSGQEYSLLRDGELILAAESMGEILDHLDNLLDLFRIVYAKK